MTDNSATTPVRRIPRITLWRCFVIITLATLIGSHVLTFFELRAAADRLARMHRNHGVARVVDPKRLAAMGTILPGKHRFRFHVRQPAEQQHVLRYGLAEVSYVEPIIPPVSGEFILPRDADFWIEVEFVEQDGFAVVQLQVLSPTAPATHIINIPPGHLVDELRSKSVEGHFRIVTGYTHQSPQPSDKLPLPLLRMGRTFTEGRDGLVLWVEHVKPMEN